MRKLILIVIDGMTPAMLEHGMATGIAPTLSRLAAAGRYETALSVFPSLTPVCLASIATGAYPDVHRIPHLAWYQREKQRLVEYGSSFAAARRSGPLRWLRDTTYAMNCEHLGHEAVTLFEALEDRGFRAAAVNTTCFRGRTLHQPTVPGVTRAVRGPSHFFYYNLFSSHATGAPFAIRRRSEGSIDDYAEAVGRWLVTRDAFDFLLYYLSDFDYASHSLGPLATENALTRSDRSIAAIVEAAGGIDEFLDRYAVIVCSDHGQTDVSRTISLERSLGELPLAGRRSAPYPGVIVTASNRAAMVYTLPGCPLEVRELALRLDREPAAEVVCFREGGEAVARREGAELRFTPSGSGWHTSGDPRVLDQPRALERIWRALANPSAGELLVSARPGFEFADIAGRSHSGGSHGSLERGDSEVPMLTVGIERAVSSITEIAPVVLEYFGLEPTIYRRTSAVAA